VTRSAHVASARFAGEPSRRSSHASATDAPEVNVAIANERERIGNVLVAGAIHSLFGIGLNLQAAASQVSEPGLLKALDEAVRDLDRTIKELRRDLFAG